MAKSGIENNKNFKKIFFAKKGPFNAKIIKNLIFLQKNTAFLKLLKMGLKNNLRTKSNILLIKLEFKINHKMFKMSFSAFSTVGDFEVQ